MFVAFKKGGVKGGTVSLYLLFIIITGLIALPALAYGNFKIFTISDGWQEKVPPTQFTSGDISSVSSAMFTNGNILTAFIDVNNSHVGAFVIHDANGNQVVGKKVFDTSYISGEMSATTLLNGNVLIAYAHDNSDGYFVVYDNSGNQIITPTIFATWPNSPRYISATTLTNGNVVIAYGESGNPFLYGTFVIYDQDGSLIKTATTFEDTASIQVTSITPLLNGNFLIAYGKYDEFYAYSGNKSFVIYNSNGNQVVGPTSFEVDTSNSSSFGPRSISATTLSNGNILIAYKTRVEDGRQGAFVIYDATGNQVVGKTIFSTDYTSSVSAASTAGQDIGIAYSDGSNYYHNLIIYDIDGNLVKAETQLDDPSYGRPDIINMPNNKLFISYPYGTSSFSGKFTIWEDVGARIYPRLKAIVLQNLAR